VAMVARPRILLVYFEGLAETVIDSTVLDHARQMGKQNQMDFVIWAFCCSKALYRNSQRRFASARQLAECELRVFRAVRPAIPFSALINGLLLRWQLRRVPEPDLIHARADYTAAVCAFAKHSRVGLIWDCRGDTVSETAERLAQWPRLPRWVKKLKLRSVVQIRRRAAAACNAAIFVTQPLADLCGAGIAAKPIAVIPTAASEDLFFFDPALRERTRKFLGFQPSHRVFVYSGSLASIQRFEDLVNLFAAIHDSDRDARLLILTPESESAKRQLASFDHQSVVVLSAALQDLNKYLNAADAAFMLRQAMPVNTVALPTKFAEYCLTGLPVIMTEAVPEACRIATKLDNWARLDGDRIRWPPSFHRADVARQARLLLGKQHLAPRYAELYRSVLGSSVLQ
jgi:glycosyltransferase involved in cell wall biosynthesis